MNGHKVIEPVEVNGGARVIFGQVHVFRFVNPKEALRARETSSVCYHRLSISSCQFQ